MYFKTFSEILHNECANCAKSLNDDFGHNSREMSRKTLLFTDIRFCSSIVEDVTNFQAISYIYGVPASVLETNIKKYLITLMRQKNNQNSPEDGDPDNSEADDPLSSLNLTLCQNCSKIISELYTSFNKFEKLSNKKSIIAKGVQYSKEKLEFQDIKLDVVDVEISKATNKILKFDELNDEGSQNLEQFELDSVKEEIESDDSQFVFHKVSQDHNSDGEDNNYDSEEAEPLHGLNMDVKRDETQHSYGIRPRRTRKQILICKANETASDDKPNEIEDKKTENFTESSDEDFSEYSEESDWFEEAADSRPSKSPKKKSAASKSRGGSKPNSGKIDKSDKTSTLRYKRRVSGHYSLKCFICKKYFHGMTGFKRHHNRCHKLWWKNSSSFKKWMDICAEQSYNCEVCDEFFISKHQLDFHKLTHIMEQDPSVECKESFLGPPFSCPKCENSNSYEHWSRLKLHGYESHQLVFTNKLLESNDICPSSYICHECRIPFTLRNRWVTHMEKIHNFIACSVGKCGEYFLDEKLLLLHIKTNHEKSTPKAEFSCKHCEKKFCTVTSLWLHIFIHIAEGEKNIAPQKYETFSAMLSGSTVDENDLTSLESGPLPASECYRHHCLNCKKRFKSFYALKIHDLAQKIDDFSKLRKEDVSGKQFTCPECGIICQRNIVLREHCLNQHTIIVSTDAYPVEEFVKELLREKDYCKSNSCLDGREPKRVNQCKRCCKIFMSYYNLMIHKSVQNVNIDNLERQILGDNCHCPKCGIEFSKKSPGPLQMKVHCLSKHNIIVSGSESQLEGFVQILQSEKIYCDEHISENTDVSSEKQKSNLVKMCRLCDKVCSSIFARKIHELAHTVDLATVEVENVEGTGTEELQCPRCPKILFSHLELREHCLSTHNVIASTALVSGDEFIQFLREEQESIENTPKSDEVGDNDNDEENEDSKNSDDDATKMDFFQETEKEESLVTGTSTHTCSICNKTFHRANVKFYHFLTHFQWKSMKVESIETPPPYTCTSCGESHRTFMLFREHCISAHGFNITNNYKGKKHLLSTSSETKIESGKGTKVKATKKKKAPEDDNEKFICDICGKMFNKRSVLHGHKRFVHKLEKSFICERCGASFKSMNYLRFHNRVHFEKDNGIRPTCNICGKSYISSKGLSKHKTEYHPKKKLSCPICKKTFASQEYAAKHIKKHKELSQTGNKRWR